jgi:hypothetical protein
MGILLKASKRASPNCPFFHLRIIVTAIYALDQSDEILQACSFPWACKRFEAKKESIHVMPGFAMKTVLKRRLARKRSIKM